MYASYFQIILDIEYTHIHTLSKWGKLLLFGVKVKFGEKV